MHFANKRNLDLGLAKVFNYFFAEKDERKRRNEKCNIFLLTSRKPAANLRKRGYYHSVWKWPKMSHFHFCCKMRLFGWFSNTLKSFTFSRKEVWRELSFAQKVKVFYGILRRSMNLFLFITSEMYKKPSILGLKGFTSRISDSWKKNFFWWIYRNRKRSL